MPGKQNALVRQKGTRNSGEGLIRLPEGADDSVSWWAEQYLRYEVTTAESSRQVQRRDLQLFLDFMFKEERGDGRVSWTPRLSRAFQEHLRRQTVDGRRRWADRTINRILAHLKTFAKWVHRLRSFPLGDPMEKIRLQPLGTGLEVERALTGPERRRMLDAADLLPQLGGRSKDRNRHPGPERPSRKGYRALRNRALIYLLIGTGMRRAAASRLDVANIDFKRRVVSVEEKGGLFHDYQVSAEALRALQDYLERERPQDDERWQSPALFLTPATNPHGDGRLTAQIVNDVWNEVARLAGVEGKTPHSARHAMGRLIMEGTGNVAAVQRQLGHRNAAYSLQYARVTAEELDEVLNRE